MEALPDSPGTIKVRLMHLNGALYGAIHWGAPSLTLRIPTFKTAIDILVRSTSQKTRSLIFDTVNVVGMDCPLRLSQARI